MQRSKNVFTFTLALAFAAAFLWLAAPSAMAQAQRCQSMGVDANFCTVDGGTCDCDFRTSEKTLVCDIATDPDCHGPGGSGGAFWPGDVVLLTLHICNAGTQDPKDCGPRPSPAEPLNAFMLDDRTGSSYYLENITIVDRNGLGPNWNPANPDLFTLYRPPTMNTPEDGCSITGDDLRCISTAGLPPVVPVFLRNNACYDLVASATVSLSHPCTDPVCNQATIIDPLNPNPPIPLMGCTSPPAGAGNGQETCVPFECTGALQITKTVNPTTYNPGDTLHYQICLLNTQTVVINDISIDDYLPDGPTDGVSWIDKTGGCIQNFTWDNPLITGIAADESTCTSADDNPWIKIYSPTGGFDLGAAGSPTDNVCFDFDMVTDATVPAGTTLCNPNFPVPPAQQSSVDYTSAPTPIIFGDDASERACTGTAGGPIFNNATTTKTANPSTNLNAGDPVTFTIDVCNTGTGPAQNVVVTDALPACFDFTGFDQTDVTVDNGDLGGNTSTGWNAVTHTITVSVTNNEPFQPGDCIQITFTLNVAAAPPPTCTNTASITWLGATSPVTRNAVITTVTTGNAAITANKTANVVSPLAPGAPLRFTITLQNTGNANATNVTLDDNWIAQIDGTLLQAGDVNVTGSTTVPVITPAPNLNITGMTILPGTTATININQALSNRLKVDDSAPNGNYCNFATGTYAGGTTPDYVTNRACFDVEATAQEARLEATKTANPMSLDPGDAFAWQIVLNERNNLGVAATNVVVTDVLADTCVDFTSFSCADVQVTGSAFTCDDALLPTLTIMGMTVPSGGAVTININQALTPNLRIQDSHPGGPCCNVADVTYLPGVGLPTAQITSTRPCMAVQPPGGINLRREGMTTSECPVTTRPQTPNTAAIFADGITLIGPVTLPYNDAGYLSNSPGNPTGNSCHLFYQVDGTGRIACVKGTNPANDVMIEAF